MRQDWWKRFNALDGFRTGRFCSAEETDSVGVPFTTKLLGWMDPTDDLTGHWFATRLSDGGILASGVLWQLLQ